MQYQAIYLSPFREHFLKYRAKHALSNKGLNETARLSVYSLGILRESPPPLGLSLDMVEEALLRPGGELPALKAPSPAFQLSEEQVRVNCKGGRWGGRGGEVGMGGGRVLGVGGTKIQQIQQPQR